MVLEAGKLYKKTGDTFVEVTSEEFVAPALTDALQLNQTTPNTIVIPFLQALSLNELTVYGSISVDHIYVQKGVFHSDRFYPSKFY